MTMPTKDKTWLTPTGSGVVYNSGVAATDAKASLLALKNYMCQSLVNVELLASGGWTSAGWTGAHPTWTHTSGNTTALSNTLAAIQYRYYTVTYTVAGRTTGDFTVTFGGGSSGAVSATGSWSAIASSTAAFVVTPSNLFDGTITFSVKGATWSAVYGCDGSNAAANGDQWATTASIIHSSAVGTAHSWQVFYNHIGAYYFKYEDCGSSSTAYNYAITIVSSATYTGGSKTSSPTTLGTTVPGTPAAGTCWNASTTQKVLHVQVTDDGTCTRVFMCQGGKCEIAWFMDTIKNPVSGIVSSGEILDKLYFSWNSLNASTDQVTYANYITADSQLSACAGGQITYRLIALGYSATAASLLTAVNPRNANTWLMSPMALLTQSGAAYAYGIDGEMFDFWEVYAATIITGDSLEANAAAPVYAFVSIGAFAIPWNGGTFTIS